MLDHPTTKPFFTVADGIAASCGAMLYLAGWSSPRGCGGSVLPNAQLMFHRLQIGGAGGMKDLLELAKGAQDAANLQQQLMYTANKIWLHNDPVRRVHFHDLASVYAGRTTLHLKIAGAQSGNMPRVPQWPDDFQSFIDAFRTGERDENGLRALTDKDEAVLLKHIPTKPLSWVYMHADVQEKPSLWGSQWKGEKEAVVEEEKVVESDVSVDMEAIRAAVQRTIGGGGATVTVLEPSPPPRRPVLSPYTAFYIERIYPDEIAISREPDPDDMAKGGLPILWIVEHMDTDDQPALTWMQRMLQAADRAGHTEIWMSCRDAELHGLSYGGLHVQITQLQNTVTIANVSDPATAERVKKSFANAMRGVPDSATGVWDATEGRVVSFRSAMAELDDVAMQSAAAHLCGAHI